MKEQSKAKSPDPGDITYSEAIKELELILDQIETGETDIDALSLQVKRALLLVKLCKAKLKSTDEEISKIMAEFKEVEQNRSVE